MNEAEINHDCTKALRQSVIQALRPLFGNGYEGWIKEDLLFDILYRFATGLTPRDVHEAAVYCECQGFAESRTRPRLKGEPKITDWRITAKGINLLEGNIEADPGIRDNRA